MEYFVFEDPVDWDYLMSLTPKERTRIMPQTIEQMHEYSIQKATKKYYKGLRAVGYWHFRRFLILNQKYQEAVETGIQDEIDYFYKLFLAYQDRQENNYGKYAPSSHGVKHPFRNTYKNKYSNKDKDNNAKG